MRVIAVSVAIVIVAGVLVEAQRRHPVSGRIFAPVMGVGGAGWLERPEREDEEAPSKALDALELKPGMVVADIGAGSGYYASRMAKRVGPSGPRLRHRHSAGHDRPARSPHPVGGPVQRDHRARRDGRPEAAGQLDRSRDHGGRVSRAAAAADLSAAAASRRSSPAGGWCCSSSGKKIRRCRSSRCTR